MAVTSEKSFFFRGDLVKKKKCPDDKVESSDTGGDSERSETTKRRVAMVTGDLRHFDALVWPRGSATHNTCEQFLK